VDSLLAWLQRPQAAWLQQRGLRPSEGIEPVQDLDALELDGLRQYQLLDQELDRHPLDGTTPDWLAVHNGRGVLPAGSGAALEQRQLAERWQALTQQLKGLGECRRESHSLGGRSRPLLFAGDVQVVVQAGQLRPTGVMQGWLQHLLLCAVDAAPAGGSAVVARSTKVAGAAVELHWRPLAAAEAQSLLLQLQDLATWGLERCWPIPPKSGWQLVWKEHNKAGSGLAGFQSEWLDERQNSVMQLCFGVDAEGDRLLKTPGFNEASRVLYGPILQHLKPATSS